MVDNQFAICILMEKDNKQPKTQAWKSGPE